MYNWNFNFLLFLFRNKVGDIFAHVTSPKLSGQYAKAREADGHFKEAAQAYETARDYDNAIRYYTNIDENKSLWYIEILEFILITWKIQRGLCGLWKSLNQEKVPNWSLGM